VTRDQESRRYRSNDGGATWQQATKDPSIAGSWYLSRVFVDPNHQQVVYVMQTCTYVRTDGANIFAFRGERLAVKTTRCRGLSPMVRNR